MNYFDDLDRFGLAPALICEDGAVLSYSAVAAAADALGAVCWQEVWCFCSEATAARPYWGTSAACACALRLSCSRRGYGSFLTALLAAYRPACIWLPQTRAAEIPGATGCIVPVAMCCCAPDLPLYLRMRLWPCW